jgi:formamidopyrimidine-DNA glycosylase
MPELPEVEVLAQHLRPLLRGRSVRRVDVRRPRVLRPTSPDQFTARMLGAKFLGLQRRGKYLLFEMMPARSGKKFAVLGHLGMTGRMFLASKTDAPPKHAAVVLNLGPQNFIYEDVRYFGRMTLDLSALESLGPEPLDSSFTLKAFAEALKRSRQAVKVKLLDQKVVAGVGNIYASEALFRAGISPRLPAHRLTRAQVERLRRGIRQVLKRAIRFGSTIPLNFSTHKSDGLFYYGSGGNGEKHYAERLRVYDRAGQPCPRCGAPIKRIVQAARSTFYCPKCQ